jgi:hypothetical protein
VPEIQVWSFVCGPVWFLGILCVFLTVLGEFIVCFSLTSKLSDSSYLTLLVTDFTLNVV